MKKNTLIRSACRADTAAIVSIYAPYIEQTVVSFEMEVPSEEDFWERIEKYQKTAPWLVCEMDGQIAGYAYAGNHRSRVSYQWSKEVSVYVHPDFRKRKVATGLYVALIELLKKQGVVNTLAGITQPNPASVAFHEKFGFRLVGIYHNIGYKMNAWRDVGWWEMPIGNLEEAPPTILLPNEIETKDWEHAVHLGVSKIM